MSKIRFLFIGFKSKLTLKRTREMTLSYVCMISTAIASTLYFVILTPDLITMFDELF